jgi:hypothetical protein
LLFSLPPPLAPVDRRLLSLFLSIFSTSDAVSPSQEGHLARDCPQGDPRAGGRRGGGRSGGRGGGAGGGGRPKKLNDEELDKGLDDYWKEDDEKKEEGDKKEKEEEDAKAEDKEDDKEEATKDE